MNNYVDLPVPKSIPWYPYSTDTDDDSENLPKYEPLEWAKKHCNSYITNDAIKINGIYYYRFYFSDQKDVTMFMLRWS